MSTWDLIEEALQAHTTALEFQRVEAYVVQEAMASLVKRRLEEGSVWPLLERVIAVKGLSPQEVQVIQQQGAGRNAVSKTGHTGTVMSLPAESWQMIQSEIEKNREYYEWMLRGEGTIDGLIQKIASASGAPAQPAQPKTAPPPVSPQKFNTGPGTEYQGLPGKTAPIGQMQIQKSAMGGGSPFASRSGQEDEPQ